MEEESRRKWHVGYYIVGSGLKILQSRQEKVYKFLPGISSYAQKHPGLNYLGGIFLITFILAAAAALYSFFSGTENKVLFSILAGLFTLIPASEVAVSIVNRIVCKIVKPAFFPRLELKSGIPESMTTIIAVPTLLPDVKRVRELLDTIEGHYLSNREKNLFFVLIGAFRDSDRQVMEDDEDIIEAAMKGIRALNRKYPEAGRDMFYFFHRERKYNEKNCKWIGWERKRGALMEFNELVLGSGDTSFKYFSCETPPFSRVKYIITLDSDTILPMGMAKKMIGTMAHPLNRPVIDASKGIVTEGYGLMQPRVDVDSESANKSLFSRIYTGQEGIDPYAHAISDVYQDLFGEGIFTGKGIYDLKVFQSVLKDIIPEDAILSHDLLEGSYVRTGLVTDLRLVDSYPSRYNSFASRLHRWVRGDWQLTPLMFRRIYDRNHNRIDNPLSMLSRWKIFDNLRRSLIAPSIFALILAGLSILPGSVLVWLGFVLITQMLPFLMVLFAYILSGKLGYDMTKRHMPVMHGLKSSFLQGVLYLEFLSYQAWLMMDAILVTLARVFITKKNLLEWVTSADMEKTLKNTPKSYLYGMWEAFPGALAAAVLTISFKPSAAIAGVILLLAWSFSPVLAWLISRDQKGALPEVTEEDRIELGRIARKTWRYFEEFANARNHHLAPDNYQVDPPRGTANRTSPTNIGMGLLAVLSARDLGYIGTAEMMDQIERTIYTMEGLEKWNGHLYNWYDTHSLKPLRPAYVSTVDSGNLAGYLITLEQGLKCYLNSPLVDETFSDGLRDTLQCTGKEGLQVCEDITSWNLLPVEGDIDLVNWNQALNDIIMGHKFDNIKETVWKVKAERMAMMFKKEMLDFMPGVVLMERMPKALRTMDFDRNIVEAVEEDFKALIAKVTENPKFSELPVLYSDIAHRAECLIEKIAEADEELYFNELGWLYELKDSMIIARDMIFKAIEKYETLIHRIKVFVEDMKFAPLYVKKRQIFSIGYDVDENKLTNSYYDLLASEARLTSYICIARGEIPFVHWFKMGRALTVVDAFKGLVSWTGTMFEYLMPLLIMKSYKNTLLDETYSFVIKSQKKYARQRNMPWGFSESGFNSIDNNLDYQYKAIGVPWLGLKRGLIEDAVAAPYATFLALLVDPVGAVQNIRLLK
ncbi:MAG: glycosyl transferase, partial [Clostridiales bacterium]|nr:glycosyl transferase [Clostridiales bacterium]